MTIENAKKTGECLSCKKNCKKRKKNHEKTDKNSVKNFFNAFFCSKKVKNSEKKQKKELKNWNLKKCQEENDKKLAQKLNKGQNNTNSEKINNVKEVLLVGNPNSGKTTLFNSLTCSDEHVGNWHGVTVENKEKIIDVRGEKIKFVDTPGLYSLCPLSYEEQVSAQTIFAEKRKIINLCDKNNLERNLYLTMCLLELGLDVVVAVNEIEKKSIYKIDYAKLSKKLGVPVIEINAQKKVGLEKLKEQIILPEKQHLLPEYIKELKLDGKAIKNSEKMAKIATFLKENKFFLKIKAFEHDENYVKNVDEMPKNSIQKIAELRYEYIGKILEECTIKNDKIYGKSKLDKIFLNKVLAFPIFVGIMALVFYLTFFSLGAFLSAVLSDFLSLLFNPILLLIENSFGQGLLYEFFNVALFGGVGTVLSFLPQVALLFFFLSVLEDSGYMARVAFIFEDILSKIGLSGKSIYTLLMGFGCSTTAIMTSRNMEDKNAKIKTALLCPYMSCSAKIPIYTVIGGAFFGANNLFLIVGLYFLGVMVAIATSKLLDLTILKSENQSFILEFPPYRRISLFRVGKILWKNIREFVLRVGTIMIAVNIIVWILSNFSFKFSYVGNTDGVSMLETFGRILSPLFVPLGFGNWAVVSALIAGLVAKEVVVSSIAMFNGIEAGATRLIGQSLLLSTSLIHFSSGASVVSFLVFCLLYTPCLASISMLSQEVGNKWTILGVLLQLFVAYVVTFVIYNIAFAIEIFGFFKIFLIFLAIFSIIFSIFLIFKKFKRKNCCSKCQKCSKI